MVTVARAAVSARRWGQEVLGGRDSERSRVSTESPLVMVKQTIQIFARVKPSVRKQQQGVRATGPGVGRVGAVGTGRSRTLQPRGRTGPAPNLSPAPGSREQTLAHSSTWACLHTHLLCAPFTQGYFVHSSGSLPPSPAYRAPSGADLSPIRQPVGQVL